MTAFDRAVVGQVLCSQLHRQLRNLFYLIAHALRHIRS
jgi:hypothetical protein